MTKYLQLQMPKTCNEDWHTMPIQEKNRFCLSCQKTVIDFTGMSDSELVQFFQKNKQPLCGRFNPQQLEKYIPLPVKRFPLRRYFFQFTIPDLLLSLKSSVIQAQRIKTPLECYPSQQTNIKLDSVQVKTNMVEGKILDEKEQPIVHASITIKGTSLGVVSDKDGKFKISALRSPVILSVSSIGYESKEIKIQDELNTLNIELSLAPMVLGGIVGGVKSPAKRTQRKPTLKTVLKALCLCPLLLFSLIR